MLGNPIRLIDPDGRKEETYKVDGEGNIEKVDDKKHYDQDGNEVDILVAGERNVSQFVRSYSRTVVQSPSRYSVPPQGVATLVW